MRPVCSALCPASLLPQCGQSERPDQSPTARQSLLQSCAPAVAPLALGPLLHSSGLQSSGPLQQSGRAKGHSLHHRQSIVTKEHLEKTFRGKHIDLSRQHKDLRQPLRCSLYMQITCNHSAKQCKTFGLISAKSCLIKTKSAKTVAKQLAKFHSEFGGKRKTFGTAPSGPNRHSTLDRRSHSGNRRKLNSHSLSSLFLWLWSFQASSKHCTCSHDKTAAFTLH